MCSVSAVMDYGRQTWPSVYSPNWTSGQPVQPAMLPDAERAALKAFMEMVEKAKQFDALAEQPHCEDPEKIKLVDKLEARIAALEALLKVGSASAE